MSFLKTFSDSFRDGVVSLEGEILPPLGGISLGLIKGFSKFEKTLFSLLEKSLGRVFKVVLDVCVRLTRFFRSAVRHFGRNGLVACSVLPNVVFRDSAVIRQLAAFSAPYTISDHLPAYCHIPPRTVCDVYPHQAPSETSALTSTMLGRDVW